MTSTQDLQDVVIESCAAIAARLAPFEASSTTLDWLDTLRAIEEMVNLVTVDWDDDAFVRRLYAFPVIAWQTRKADLQFIRERLIQRFSENFANRFCNLVSVAAATANALAKHGFMHAAIGLQSFGSAIGFLQSRRRHFVAVLHLLPTACVGQQRIQRTESLQLVLPLVELIAVPMMGSQHELMVRLAQQRLGLPENSNNELAMLDALMLEPERAPITAMAMVGAIDGASLEPLRSDRLFSAAELRNDIQLIEAAYAEFNIRASEFAPAADLVRRLSRDFVDRDFWVNIEPAELNVLFGAVGVSPSLRQALLCPADSYMKCLSTYAPLLLLDGTYRSTVTLLSRFIYSWRARTLDRSKRFQIRAGFIFEEMVKQELTHQGFHVEDIVRINRQEFDVVTTRDQVIWNVQCKNNFIDLDRVDSNAITFARYNNGLVRSYERALVKERGREQLLKDKLGLAAIQHMVVSRFPVVCNNPQIVVFSRISELVRRADALLRP